MLECVQMRLSMEGMPSCDHWGWTWIRLNASSIEPGIRYMRLRCIPVSFSR